MDALCGLITDPLPPHRVEVITEAGYVTHDDLFSYGVKRALDGDKVRLLKETIGEVGRGAQTPGTAFWNDPRARDYWLGRFDDEENPRRETAITALSNYDDPAVWDLIREAAENDPSRLVRYEAQKVLEKKDNARAEST
jgi:hypothetical protein